MVKNINHIKLWNYWRKRNINNKFYKIMVLLRLAHSPTFEMEKRYKKWINGFKK